MKPLLIAIAVVLGAFLLLAGANLLGLEWARFFSPKWENVRRNVFEETQSYNRGIAQQLAKAMREYQATPDSSKAALRAVIAVQYADYEDENLDPVLRNFLKEVRGY